MEGSKNTLSRDQSLLIKEAQKTIDVLSNNTEHAIEGFTVDVEAFAELSNKDTEDKTKQDISVKLAETLTLSIDELEVIQADLLKDINQWRRKYGTTGSRCYGR